MAVGSLFGLGFAEPLPWLGISIMSAWLIVARARANYFLHGSHSRFALPGLSNRVP